MISIPRISDTIHTLSESWKLQEKNWMFAIANRFSIGCSVLSIAAIVWKWRILPPLIPLWRSRPWGTDQLAHPMWLFILPISALLWHGIDVLLSLTVTKDHHIFSQILLVSSMLVGVLSGVAVLTIIFLVT